MKKKMDYIKEITKEPRSIIAIVNIISFFLPWISFDVSVSAFGVGADYSTSITGFGMISYSVFGVLFYIMPIIIIAIPFVKALKEYEKYLYLILPIWSIVAMFITCSILKPAQVEVTLVDNSLKIPKLIGFWIALLCNVLILVITILKKKGVMSASSNETNNNLKNINVKNISNVAREIGASIQSSAFVECKKCGNKIQRGKKFCPNCGEKIVVEQKIVKKYQCSQCGRKASANEKFCSECGAPIKEYVISTTCPNCGGKVSSDAAFCSSCGAKIERGEE